MSVCEIINKDIDEIDETDKEKRKLAARCIFNSEISKRKRVQILP